MRILQLTNRIPFPPKDGGAIATLNIAKGLAGCGNKVTILGMNTSKHYYDLTQIPAELKNLIEFRDVLVNTHINTLSALSNLFLSNLPYNAKRFFSKGYNHALESILKEKQFDVVQLEGLYMAWYIKTIRDNSKAIISLRAHNIEHEIWLRNSRHGKNILKRLYLENLSRRIKKFKLTILNSYDILVPITDRDSTTYSAIGNIKPTITIPAGLDFIQLLPETERDNPNTVFFIGTLDWLPNQEGLLWFIEKVWPVVLNTDPNIFFHVAGRNAPEWLKWSLQNTKNLIFHGEIDDARDYMNSYALMVVPLFSGGGMRVKIIEGMALGKPIITTSIGAEGIAVTPGYHLVIEDIPQKFAGRIIEILKDKELFKNIGINARKFSEANYDYMVLGQKLSNFYQKHLS